MELKTILDKINVYDVVMAIQLITLILGFIAYFKGIADLIALTLMYFLKIIVHFGLKPAETLESDAQKPSTARSPRHK